MKEIKFRAWDEKEKEFNFLNLREAIANDDAYSLCASFANCSIGECSCDLQQFTGLKDKNGKEIYEGDIVFLENGEYSWQGIIQWNADETKFEAKELHVGEEFCFGNDFSNEEVEITGNIYENPELMK